MQYWLMKSEPDVWSIDQQKKAGKKGAAWDGVRNYQAANNLKKMKIGDLCFFWINTETKLKAVKIQKRWIRVFQAISNNIKYNKDRG